MRRCRSARREGSELFRSEDAEPLFVLGVRAERFCDRPGLYAFALRELLYAEDMLDPAFGHRPALPPGLEPARRELVRDRYRVLWEARVAGRMARAGVAHGPPDGAPPRFRRAFGRAADPAAVDALYGEAFGGGLATQAALLEPALSGVTAPGPPTSAIGSPG